MDLTVTENGVALNLTEVGLTFQLRWEKPDGTVSMISLSAFNLLLGQLRQNWVAGNTDAVGTHQGQIVITNASSQVSTYPSDGSVIYWFVYPQLPD